MATDSKLDKNELYKKLDHIRGTYMEEIEQFTEYARRHCNFTNTKAKKAGNNNTKRYLVR